MDNQSFQNTRLQSLGEISMDVFDVQRLDRCLLRSTKQQSEDVSDAGQAERIAAESLSATQSDLHHRSRCIGFLRQSAHARARPESIALRLPAGQGFQADESHWPMRIATGTTKCPSERVTP